MAKIVAVRLWCMVINVDVVFARVIRGGLTGIGDPVEMERYGRWTK